MSGATIETPRGTISLSTVMGMAGAHVAASTLNFVSGTSLGAMCCIRLWKCQHSCCETESAYTWSGIRSVSERRKAVRFEDGSRTGGTFRHSYDR